MLGSSRELILGSLLKCDSPVDHLAPVAVGDLVGLVNAQDVLEDADDDVASGLLASPDTSDGHGVGDTCSTHGTG